MKYLFTFYAILKTWKEGICKMNEVESAIYNEVKRRCLLPTNAYGIGAWDHHIKLVYEIAIAKCYDYNANRNIVALAALLHDIASVTNKEYTKEHP